MASDTRIVLVKPGDVLMLGNVTLPEGEALDAFTSALRTLKDVLHLEHDVLVFEDDIDLAVKPGDGQQPGWYASGGVTPCSADGTAEHIRHGLDYVRERYGKDRQQCS